LQYPIFTPGNYRRTITIMYHHVFVAGTFDRLHAGHQELLTRACEAGEKVTIGLTSDAYISQYKSPGVISLFTDRKHALAAWLDTRGYQGRATIIPIDDPYEPAVSDPVGEILVVTPDTKARGEEINSKRKAKGLAPYALLVVPLVPAQDRMPITSTRVRSGEIDTSGRLVMPDSLRPELSRPIGRVLVGDQIGSSIEVNRNGTIITVGDITTETLLTAGVVPHLAIIDFQVQRKPFRALDAKFTQLNLYRVHVASGPGYITREALTLIQKWATHPEGHEALIVDGEEDLLTIPAVAYSPLGSIVYYGQPNAGLVEVEVTEDKKSEALAIIRQFIS